MWFEVDRLKTKGEIAHLVHSLMSQKSRSGIFLRNSCQCDFFYFWRRLLTEIAKKSSWHFFGGHLEPLAAQNPIILIIIG